MSKITRREWYRRVNAAWPTEVPALTGEEAIKAARKLYRFGTGRTFKGSMRLTSGRRYTWIRRNVFSVNPERGWKDLVHLISHLPAVGVNSHNKDHALVELRMIKEVVKRGWLDGRLKGVPKPEPAAPSKQDVRSLKIAHARAALARWESKRKRADTAIKKYRRSIAALERAQRKEVA